MTNKSENENVLSIIGLFVIGMLIMIPLYFYEAHVIHSAALLYQVDIIAGIPKSTIIFILLVINLITMKADKKDKKTLTDAARELIYKFIMALLLISMSWGMFYFLHLFV